MSLHRQSLGRWGETLAADYLSQKGYVLLDRNLRTPYGEIDLIAQKGDTLVFVEVKTRASKTLGPPEISVTPRKREHLLASVQAYVQEHARAEAHWRIDVIAIQKGQGGLRPEIVHFENAIT